MSSRSRPVPAARWLTLVLGAAAAGLLASAAFARFGDSWWLFDVFTHFRWQYFALAAVVIPLALLCRARWIALAALIGAAAHLPVLFEPVTALALRTKEAPADITLMNANLWWRNDRLDALLGRVKVADADVVVMQEVSGPWLKAVETLRAHYPHVAPADWRNSGIVILSRHPIRDLRADAFTVSTEIDVRGRTVRLIAVHMPTPLSAAKWRLQAEAFQRVAAEARNAGMPVIAIGDFNLTPYSPRFARFLAESGLRRVPIGRFWPATWPSASGLKYGGPLWRGFEIDHVLVSDTFAPVGAYRGPDIGSDHFPIHVALKFVR